VCLSATARVSYKLTGDYRVLSPFGKVNIAYKTKEPMQKTTSTPAPRHTDVATAEALPIISALTYHARMQNHQPGSDQNRQILSPSQLNRKAKQLLETHLPLLWVEGEISNFSCPSSGHWYLSLKDSQAQLRCAMFKGRNRLVKFRPENGKKVIVRGRVSLYEGRGDYQLIIEHMQVSGDGDLQLAFEQLKQKLHSEGLFEASRKREIPNQAQHIGVITSPTGAAVQDILSVLKRRNPIAKVSVFPVAVQGKEAAGQIAQAIHTANQYSDCDVLIIGRGGGSLEDLWSFNEELVARAIAASAIPTLSAVGHEVDFSIADLVADQRAPTPSAAAELVSTDINDQLEIFQGYEILLEQALRRKLQQQSEKVKHLSSRLRHPGERLNQQAQKLDHLELRLKRNIQNQLVRRHQTLQQHKLRLNAKKLDTKAQREHLSGLDKRLHLAQQQTFNHAKQRLGNQAQLLHSVSPLNTLNRGYSIIRDQNNRLVDNAKQLQPGDQIVAQLKQGKLHCEVKAAELGD